MIFLAIGILAYIVYPPAVVYIASAWALVYLFSFTASIIRDLSA